MKICVFLSFGLMLAFPLFAAEKSTKTDQLPMSSSAPAVPKAEEPLVGKPKLGPAATPEKGGNMPKPYIASISVYGSNRLNETVIRESFGADLDNWIKKGLAGEEASVDMELALAEKIKKKFGLAFAEWSIIQFFEPEDLAIHITLDVVEKEDAARRMPFLAEPTGQYADPDKLIQTWKDYEDTAFDLVESGAIIPDSEKCPAVHCPFGHRHEKLKRYEKIFSAGVKKNEKILTEILKKDANAEDRAMAAYLLAYLNDAKKVAGLLIDSVRDSDSLVRNNVLRVLGDIAEKYKDVVIPSAPILEALDFPRTSDRSKAIYVAFMLATSSQSVRDEIAKRSVPTLIAMIQGKQPDQKEFAYNILRKVSGKDFPVTDALAWTNWYKKSASDRTVTGK